MGLPLGDVDATTVAYAKLRRHVEAGKLKTLAVMSDKRVARSTANYVTLLYCTTYTVGVVKETTL